MKKLRVLNVLILASLAGVGGQLAFGQTSSPFPPPKEQLGVYVINSGAGLDTGCTFRSGGPLIVRLAVPATMNSKEVRSDGTLNDVSKLVSASVIGATARIRFPVFDIDSSANVPGIAPEIDKVSFNEQFKKTLTGINNQWTDDSLTVPISEIKFQSSNSLGVMNELRVDIDQGNIGVTEAWCMAIDWVSIEFETAAPYILMHGIDATSSTWDESNAPGVLSTLDNAGVLWTRFTTGKNQRSSTNAADLRTKISNFLAPLKGDKINVIAHSKGGLDCQMLASLNPPPPFKVLSLTTLSTPHLGSVASDLSLIAKAGADDLVNTGEDPNGYASTYINTWTFGQGPQLPGLRDLSTYEATAALAAGTRGNIQPTYSFGADADLNSNNDLEKNKSADLFPAAAHYAAKRAWLVMRDFSSAPVVSTVTVPGKVWGTRTVLTYQTNPGGPFENDIVVTVNSANPTYATPQGNVKANHSTIKAGARIQQILPLTLPLR